MRRITVVSSCWVRPDGSISLWDQYLRYCSGDRRGFLAAPQDAGFDIVLALQLPACKEDKIRLQGIALEIERFLPWVGYKWHDGKTPGAAKLKAETMAQRFFPENDRLLIDDDAIEVRTYHRSCRRTPTGRRMHRRVSIPDFARCLQKLAGEFRVPQAGPGKNHTASETGSGRRKAISLHSSLTSGMQLHTAASKVVGNPSLTTLDDKYASLLLGELHYKQHGRDFSRTNSFPWSVTDQRYWLETPDPRSAAELNSCRRHAAAEKLIARRFGCHGTVGVSGAKNRGRQRRS